MLLGQRFQLIVVKYFVGIQAVGDEVIQFARSIDGRTVRKVAAFGQAHAQYRVARLEDSHVHTLIGLRAGVWLYVGGFSTKELLESVDGKLLNDINVLAPAVITSARIAFGVLVGQLGSLCLHDSRAGVVFRGNQLDVLLLANIFFLYGRPDFGIHLVKGTGTIKHGASWQIKGVDQAYGI